MGKPICISIVLLLAFAGAASAGFIAFWNDTEASIPSGWTCISCDAIPMEGSDSADFYQRFPVCNLSNYGNYGGNDNHTHTLSHQATGPSSTLDVNVGFMNGFNAAGPSHTHSSVSVVNGSLTNTSLPPYMNLRIIRTTTTFPSFIPEGVIILFNSTSIPSGFTRFSEADNHFPRGDDSIATTGGSENHSHGTLNLSLQGGTQASVAADPFKFSIATHLHKHTFNNQVTNESNHIPPYFDVVMIQADSDQPIPNGTIAIFNQTIEDASWTQVNECSDQYLRAAEAYGTSGGSATHTHPMLSGYTGDADSRLKWDWDDLFTLPMAYGYHYHSINISFSAEENQPPYRTVLLYAYQFEPLVDNETVAREAIEEGINSSTPNATIYTDQQIYIVNEYGEHSLGRFDKVSVLDNQTWGFNYLTGNETATNMTSLFDVVNIWEEMLLTYSQIVSQVSDFIEGTKQ